MYLPTECDTTYRGFSQWFLICSTDAQNIALVENQVQVCCYLMDCMM